MRSLAFHPSGDFLLAGTDDALVRQMRTQRDKTADSSFRFAAGPVVRSQLTSTLHFPRCQTVPHGGC